MEKTSIFGDNQQRSVNPRWFTGRVWMRSVSEKIRSEKQDIYHVHFHDGARTKLHLHNGSQILLVTQGKGSLELYRARGSGNAFDIEITEKILLFTGDAVCIPQDTLHTHGSIEKSEIFSHVAINNLPCGVGEYTTAWYETDANRVTSRI